METGHTQWTDYGVGEEYRKGVQKVRLGDSKIWPISCKLEQYDTVKLGNITVLLKDSSDKYLIRVA